MSPGVFNLVESREKFTVRQAAPSRFSVCQRCDLLSASEFNLISSSDCKWSRLLEGNRHEFGVATPPNEGDCAVKSHRRVRPPLI
ncbi:hypothetical protein AOLI_G00104020 [Acnodon oligacanthus]